MSTKVQVKPQTKSPAAPEAANVMRPPLVIPDHELEQPDTATQLEDATRLGHSLGAVSVDGSTPSIIQRQELPEEEEEEKLQMKLESAALQQQGGGEGFRLDDETAGRINRARSGGQPLDGAVQAQMGETMGHNFSGVRVHTDTEADALNQQLSARAFTTGQDVFFRRGEYSSGTSSGRELLAHELSHVVQQSTGRVRGGGGLTVRPAGDVFEQEAEAKAIDANKHLNKAALQRAIKHPGIVQRELTKTAIRWLELRKNDQAERMERGRSLLAGQASNILAHLAGNCHETVWFVSRLIQGKGVEMIKGPASESGKVGAMYGDPTPWNGGQISYGAPVGFRDVNATTGHRVAGYFHSAIAIGQGAKVKGVNGLDQLGNGWKASDLAQLPQTNGQGPSYRTVQEKRDIQIMIGK